MKRWAAGDWIGTVVFALLLGVRLAQMARGQIMVLPLAVQAGLAAFLMLARRAEQKGGAPRRKLLAWLSALLPFTLQARVASTGLLLVSLTGVGLSLWGLASLGRSFGIAPADRGLMTCGAYRLVRHPMYLGELISFLALFAGNVTIWNAVVMATIVVTFILRIIWEEQVVSGYEDYRQLVRWRLIPGVW